MELTIKEVLEEVRRRLAGKPAWKFICVQCDLVTNESFSSARIFVNNWLKDNYKMDCSADTAEMFLARSLSKDLPSGEFIKRVQEFRMKVLDEMIASLGD